jgi:hypothetical protein
MKIVPARVEQQINRVDRTPSLVIGIICAVAAAWCLMVLLQLMSLLMMFQSFGWLFTSLAPQFLLYGAVGGVAAIAAIGFLTRYAKRP